MSEDPSDLLSIGSTSTNYSADILLVGSFEPNSNGKGGGNMREDQCDCPKFGISCMAIRKVDSGVLILVDETCSTIAYFKRRTDDFLTKKHVLYKGGDTYVLR